MEKSKEATEVLPGPPLGKSHRELTPPPRGVTGARGAPQPADIRDRSGGGGREQDHLAGPVGSVPRRVEITEPERAFDTSLTCSCRDGESRLAEAGDEPRTDRTGKGQSRGRDRRPGPLRPTRAQRPEESTAPGNQLLYVSLLQLTYNLSCISFSCRYQNSGTQGAILSRSPRPAFAERLARQQEKQATFPRLVLLDPQAR